MAETLGMGNRIESCPLPVVFVFKIQTGIYTRQIFVLRMFVHDKFSGDIVHLVRDQIRRRSTVYIGMRKEVESNVAFFVSAFVSDACLGAVRVRPRQDNGGKLSRLFCGTDAVDALPISLFFEGVTIILGFEGQSEFHGIGYRGVYRGTIFLRDDFFGITDIVLAL